MLLETEDITWVLALNIKRILLITYCFVLFFSCTENPLFKENINTSARQTITGRVTLENQSDHSNIFVYFEGLNILTLTDKEGNFQITLPDNIVQSNGKVSGYFYIYYYVANYRLERSRVAISNGIFVYAESDLDGNGRIKNHFTQVQLLP